MYEHHFGLDARPFSIAPDPRYLFPSARHREALAHLLYGVHDRGGLVVLTGEVGTGKTLITRTLVEQLPADVDLALVLNPKVTVLEFLLVIYSELKIELPPRSYSTQALIHGLNAYLLEAYGRGRHTVILVDEAQLLSAPVLEQVRLLTNLETTREKLLQIILVGQPELRQMLGRSDLRQVSQRVTARYHLRPLGFAATRQYVAHRCRVAGARQALFSLPAQWLIHRGSRGIPRLINVFCDRALLGSYAHKRARVGVVQAARAIREVNGLEPRGRRWAAATVGALLAAALGVSFLSGVHEPWLAATPPAKAHPVAVETAREVPPPEPVLTEWLQQSEAALAPALRELFGLWQTVTPQDGPESACERALDVGLRCFYRQAGWADLRRKNLPAILELSGGAGVAYRVLLRRIDGEIALLSVGGRQHAFPLSEVDPLWDGSYLVLWRPPAIGREVLLPGNRGVAIDWLAHRLARIDGGDGPATGGQVYDRLLQERVRAFQRAQELEVDGIVGENTLIHLMAAAPEAGTPRLQD
jgi:general secretion pathway protein A